MSTVATRSDVTPLRHDAYLTKALGQLREQINDDRVTDVNASVALHLLGGNSAFSDSVRIVRDNGTFAHDFVARLAKRLGAERKADKLVLPDGTVITCKVTSMSLWYAGPKEPFCELLRQPEVKEAFPINPDGSFALALRPARIAQH